MSNVFDALHSGAVGALRDAVTTQPEALLLRNEQQQTPLSVAIRLDVAVGGGGGASMTSTLLGAAPATCASSVFVHGYSPNSLVCTLPMATQPSSSVVTHEAPLIGVDPALLEMIDVTLAKNVQKMVTDEQAEEARIKKAEAADQKKRAAALATPKVVAAAPVSTFNHFPAQLSVGDHVRRALGWRWGR